MKLIIFILTFYFSIPSQANCPQPLKSGFETYLCILEQTPSVQRMRFRAEENQALVAKAAQFPNPELDAGMAFSGDRKFEISILQPIEIGGKRSSRIEKSRAESSLLSATDLETRIAASNAALETLIRLRQLKTEAELVKNSLSVLVRVNRRLKIRTTLSPEQKNASRLFSTFEKTLRFRLLSIERDYQKTNASIEAAIGRALTKNDQVFVGTFKEWPSLDITSLNNQTAAQRISLAELEVAKAELKAAQSESWPDFRLGPSVERLPEQNETSWGIKLGMTLPLWNLNGAGRELAKIRMSSTEASLAATKRQQQSELDALQKQYVELTKILSETEPVSEVILSVKESERLFDRLLISPGSLIEMYRSTFELVEEIHKNEVQAMLTWLTVENLKGTFPKDLP